jgi:hypothetical protein
MERTTGIEPAHASLATTRVTLTHPHVGWCGWICTSYLRLIGPTRICMCFTPSSGLSGRNQTCVDLLPRQADSHYPTLRCLDTRTRLALASTGLQPGT